MDFPVFVFALPCSRRRFQKFSKKKAEHLFEILFKFYKKVVLVPALALGVEAALAVEVEVEVGKRVGRR